MFRFLNSYRKTVFLSFGIFWLLFACLWGPWSPWGWNDNVLWSSGWWFDFAGHALFGVAMGTTLFYSFLTYSLHGFFHLGGQKLLVLIVVGSVAILAALWEGAEFVWDTCWDKFLFLQTHFPNLKAQGLSGDTTIDVLIAVISAFITMLLYTKSGAIYKKRYMDEAERERQEDLFYAIEELAKETSRDKREHRPQILWDMIKLLRHSQTKKK